MISAEMDVCGSKSSVGYSHLKHCYNPQGSQTAHKHTFIETLLSYDNTSDEQYIQ